MHAANPVHSKWIWLSFKIVRVTKCLCSIGELFIKRVNVNDYICITYLWEFYTKALHKLSIALHYSWSKCNHQTDYKLLTNWTFLHLNKITVYWWKSHFKMESAENTRNYLHTVSDGNVVWFSSYCGASQVDCPRPLAPAAGYPKDHLLAQLSHTIFDRYYPCKK